MSHLKFDLDDDSYLSSDDDYAQINNVKKSPTCNNSKNVRKDLIEKFESLKSERIRNKLKHEKKLAKKLRKNLKSPTINDIKKDSASSSTSKTKTVNLKVPINEQDLENMRLIESKIDIAIKDADFESAESLSNELAAKQSDLNEHKIQEALEFMNKNKDNNQSPEKKPLCWQFEAKKRWESKANM
jgi:hypothetical protein